MSHPEPPRPGSDDDSVPARAPVESSLEDLMGRIRLELTGSGEDVLQTARIAGEAAVVRAEAAGLAAEVLSLDEVINRIRRELKRRRGGASGSAPDTAAPTPERGRLPRWQSSVAPLPIQSMYVLADMLRPSDGEFVDNAFRILLRRSASVEEKAHYLAELRGGIGKVEILGTIRFSDEGMRHSVHVDGLLIPYKLHKWRRIPVLGWFLATGIALFRLPRLFAHLQKLEAASAQESQHVGHALNDLAQAVESSQTRLDEQLDTVAGLQRRVQAKLSEQMSVLTSTIDHLHQQLAVQASASVRVETRLDQLEQLEAAMMARLESVQASLSARTTEQVGRLESAMARLESMQRSLSAHTAEQVDQLEMTMKARLESMEASLSEHTVEQVGQLETVMAARLDSTQASLTAQVETRLEQVKQFEAAMTSRVESTQASLATQIETRLEQIKQFETAMTSRFESAQTLLSSQVETRLEQFKQFETATIARVESVQADQAGVQAQLESRLDTGLASMAKMTAEGTGACRAVRDIERRLTILFDRLNQPAKGSSAAAPSGASEGQADSGFLAAHYVLFEDTFRGTRDDIKQRAGHYLTVFREAGIRAGDGLVVDLGCGRGEWLEVLSEHGYASRGVDLNGVMVGEAQASGLDAVEQDAIAHLRSLDNESVVAITSMHLVEHLPYEVLIRLVDEALRVLQPGGVLILETPNPENLTVGSYWFYMDPTHRNPIPPPLLRWVVEARGFEGATIDRLTQNRGVFDIQPVGEDVAGASQINKIVGLLTAAPDYAIVARKPHPGAALEQGT